MAGDGEQEGTRDRRIFISGISKDLSRDELQKRLEGYGTVTQDVELNLKNADTTGTFAHCSLRLSQGQWDRLRKLSGAVLKGSKLLIEESKPDYKTRIALRAAKPDPIIPNSRKRPARDTLPAVESRKLRRGELVKDNDITQKSRKRGWIKGRYGRAIAVLRIDGQPALKRNPDALSKLWGSAHPSSDQLTCWYDDDFEEWYDRRGRLIKCPVISKRKHPVELTTAGRVEVWDSGDDAHAEPDSVIQTDPEETSAMVEDVDLSHQSIDEIDLDAQLKNERTLGMAMLDHLFKDTKDEDVKTPPQLPKSQRNDRLDIIPRYDPNASDDHSESGAELSEPEQESPPIADALMDDANGTEAAAQSPEMQPTMITPTHQVDSSNLTAIFESRTKADTEPFKLFQTSEELDQEEGGEAQEQRLEMVQTEHNDIHPDRLKQASTAQATEIDQNSNANYIALARDRGFSLTTPSSREAFPLLFSTGQGSINEGVPDFFPVSIDLALVKSRWEEQRLELTQDWKRKRREGTKKMRKAKARRS